jgi:uncharacterized glyoxalase superfamily protein PhnB
MQTKETVTGHAVDYAQNILSALEGADGETAHAALEIAGSLFRLKTRVQMVAEATAASSAISLSSSSPASSVPVI